MVTTTTGHSQTICKQALITIFSQGMEIEVPVLIVKNLVYDIILGTNTLRKIHATIDFANKTLKCIILNKLHTIILGHKQSNICLLYTSLSEA